MRFFIKKWENEWETLLTYEKIARIVGSVFSIATIVLAVLSILELVDMVYVEITLGLMTLANAGCYWREQRSIAYLNLGVGIFILCVVVIVLCL